ncbi:hypothetical protein [Sphingomonas sp. TPD3009]|nr:hypothetical protein [Sphingomonas sp. TPD3009]
MSNIPGLITQRSCTAFQYCTLASSRAWSSLSVMVVDTRPLGCSTVVSS